MHMTVLDRLHRRLRDERGYTVLLALMVLVVTSMLLAATYVAVTGDTGATRTDLDQQRAYTAAEAGISQYIFQLNQNPDYWNTCAGYPTPITGTVGSSDNGSVEQYSYRPIAATTAPSTDQHCDTANAIGTMIEGSSSMAPGTFRVASTGWSGPAGTTLAKCTPAVNCVERTIVAQLKQPSFLNYVYYTDYETLDPAALYDPSAPYRPGNTTEPTDCAQHYPNRGSDCGSPIDFTTGDVINGPLHSEDTLAICGSPTFGRSGYNDALETPGLSTEQTLQSRGSTCQQNATINNSAGTNNPNAPSLTPPASNSQMLSIAQAGGYVYTGATTIVLTGATMTVTSPETSNTSQHPTGTGVAWPSNGVIYVANSSSGCGVTYTPFTANADYTSDADCGDAYVSGNYTSSLTINTANDIIINGNITSPTVGAIGTAPSGGQELGLVADDFVRVYNSVPDRTLTTSGNCVPSRTPNPPSVGTPVTEIYAALLSVTHSFIVDNYDCGSNLGTLTVWGAIAQLYRGPVGTSGGTGYLKNYNYDDRLATTEPPYFLSPSSTAWYVSRETECELSTC
jgi:hypothetical protein